MRKMKVLLAKCSNVALSLMAVMAMIFANSLCRGRLYEPELPEELKQDNVTKEENQTITGNTINQVIVLVKAFYNFKQYDTYNVTQQLLHYLN